MIERGEYCDCNGCRELSDERDRLRAALAAAGPVVEAARALLEHRGEHMVDRDVAWWNQEGDLLDQLAARVRAHTDTTGDSMCPFCERPRRLCWCDR